MSSSFTDQTPLAQINTHLDLAESYACQSGRQSGFPGLAPEEENQVFTRLRQQLTARNKLIQVSLLDRYRNICANSTSRCPPLPITGIKACLYIMKIIKPDTERDAIDRLANVFETWRVMLVVEVGPTIAGADSVWTCTALRELVDKAPLAPSRHASEEQSAPKDRPSKPLHQSPSLPRASQASSAPSIELDSTVDHVHPARQITSRPSEILNNNLNLTRDQTPAAAPPIVPRPFPAAASVPSAENSRLPQNTFQKAHDARPSGSFAERSLDQPAGVIPHSSGALSVEITEWLTAVRLMDDALTDYLNLPAIPSPHASMGVSPYQPPPFASSYCSSLKHIPLHAPLTFLSTYNPTLVVSAPQAFGLSPFNFIPIATSQPVIRKLAPSPSNRNSSTSLAMIVGHPQSAGATVNTKPPANRPTPPQSSDAETPVCASPPAISDAEHPRELSETNVQDNEDSHASAPSALKVRTSAPVGMYDTEADRAPSVSTPETRSSLASLHGNETLKRLSPHHPSVHDATLPPKHTNIPPVDPALLSVPPPFSSDMRLTSEQKMKLMTVFRSSTAEERKKLVLALKKRGFTDFFLSQSSNSPAAGSLPQSSHNRHLAAALEPPRQATNTPPPSSSLEPTVLHHALPIEASNTHFSNTPPTAQPSSEDAQTSTSIKDLAPRQTTKTLNFATLPKNQLEGIIARIVQAILSKGPQPLATIMTTFARLNVPDNHAINLHIRALAQPLSEESGALWALKSPNSVGSVGNDFVLSGALGSQSQDRTQHLDNSHPEAITSSSSLTPTPRSGSPMTRPFETCSRTSVPPSLFIDTSPPQKRVSDSRDAQLASQVDQIDNSSNTESQPHVIPKSSDTNPRSIATQVGKKRMLPSDEEMDPTDTLTDTTQGSCEIAPVEKYDDEVTDSTRPDRSVKRRLLKPDIQFAIRKSRCRKSESPASRVTTPSALHKTSPPPKLEPFVDDLPGFPVVDRTIQRPGTRARILIRYDAGHQMAPLRTFVPINCGKLSRSRRR